LNIFYAWICVFSPLIGAALTPVLAVFHPKIRDYGAVFFSFLSAFAAVNLLPDLLKPAELPIESAVIWLTHPIKISFGVLIDPLSIILSNVVAVISFIIMVYCIGYMKGDPAITRFWMWMNAFIGSMLLLVLSNNLLFIFIGWKLVGICSYGLIGFYYKDERQYWIGGPPPAKFVTPSQASLKALVMTGFGDLLMLGGILIVFFYSNTLNLLELYNTSSAWIPEMAKSPGILSLVAILLLAGPIGKSAQFPLHEWLPEAMAGPGPVSALIHAATMVKSGVYLVARFIPVFYYGYWAAGCQEAALFFALTAWIGLITAFMAATQGMVSPELKKVLAYSTVSQIGYMMLGLGVAGFSPRLLVEGYSSGIFHLVSHALFKACLFLCAGSVIHAAHSIYLRDMGALKQYMPFTRVFMTIAALSLMGFPPLPGFWSKDAILLSTVEAGFSLFIPALITVVITSFYTTRLVGLVFHGPESESIKRIKQKGGHFGEALPVMWVACGILAVLIVKMGLMGIQVERAIENAFNESLVARLKLPVEESHPSSAQGMIPVLSVICVILGAVPGYLIYISKRYQPENLLEKSLFPRLAYRFFRERWYIDNFYHFLFVNGLVRLAHLIVRSEERINLIFHKALPAVFTRQAYGFLRVFRTETRELAFNIIYILLFFILFVGFFFTVV